MTYAYRFAFTISLFVLSSVAAGCGPSSGKSNPANLDELLNRFFTILCKEEVSCGSMPDQATCLASVQKDTTEFATLRADIASGKVRYDSVQGGACMDYFERVYGGACTRSALAAATATPTDACNAFLVGSVADGGACFSSSECVSTDCALTDTSCSRSDACCAGTCTAKPTPIPLGGDCSALTAGQSCATGSICITNSSTGARTCAAPSKVKGTTCAGFYDCASPLYCDTDAATGTGTCQPAAATGAACNPAVTFGSCDDNNDYCDKTTGKCTRRLAVGAACDSSQYNCVGYATCLGGMCSPASPERGACDTVNGPSCLGDLECSTTTNTCGFTASAGACVPSGV
jgi:hypothetical protein